MHKYNVSGANGTCLLASMGLQLNVTYSKRDNTVGSGRRGASTASHVVTRVGRSRGLSCDQLLGAHSRAAVLCLARVAGRSLTGRVYWPHENVKWCLGFGHPSLCVQGHASSLPLLVTESVRCGREGACGGSKVFL